MTVFQPDDRVQRARLRNEADVLRVIGHEAIFTDGARASTRMIAEEFDGARDLVALLDYVTSLEDDLANDRLLTKRSLKRWLDSGATYVEIAEHFGVSVSTVQSYVVHRFKLDPAPGRAVRKARRKSK